MAETIQDLRVELRRASRGLNGGRLRFPMALRRKVGAFARRGVGDGTSQSRLARQLGISQPTLRRWMEEAETGRFVPVEIAEAPSSDAAGFGLRLRTPQGYLIEGLDVQTLTTLLRVLG